MFSGLDFGWQELYFEDKVFPLRFDEKGKTYFMGLYLSATVKTPYSQTLLPYFHWILGQIDMQSSNFYFKDVSAPMEGLN